MPEKFDKGTEEQILDAAYRVIIRKGKAGARMQEIADEAGVNKALLHYYFRSKDKIYTAVMKGVIRELLETVTTDLDFTAPYETLIKQFIRRHISAIQKNSEIIPFFFSEVQFNYDEMAPLFRSYLNTNENSLPQQFFLRTHQAIEEKEIRLVNPFQLLMNIISLDVFYFIAKPVFSNLLGFSQEQQQMVEKDRAEEVADFIWEAIRLKET